MVGVMSINPSWNSHCCLQDNNCEWNISML